jgi:uncharacterized Tic20 family protein
MTDQPQQPQQSQQSQESPQPPPGYQAPPPHQPPGAQAYAPGYTAAQPMTPDQERNWATLAHVVPLVAMVISAGTLGFVGSLVIYLLYRDRGPFGRQHAANSLNIQIITGIVLLISFPLMLLLVGFVTYFAALVFAFILHIIAAMKANQGEWYRPPLTPDWVK